MRVNAEKMALLFVVACLVLTSIVTLVWGRTPLTREEAIEISKNTQIVQRVLSESMGIPIIEADYWNADYIIWLRNSLPGKVDVYENLPTDHGVWRVHWVITPPGYHILHFIDELTGLTLYEGWFVVG